MTTLNAMAFTCEDADRLLQLADQFLEDWEENEGTDDPDCIERRSEWDIIRPVLAESPKMLNTLLNIKRLAESSDDDGYDPHALLDLIACEARAAVAKASGGSAC
jgi:hypothetical protein